MVSPSTVAFEIGSPLPLWTCGEVAKHCHRGCATPVGNPLRPGPRARTDECVRCLWRSCIQARCRRRSRWRMRQATSLRTLGRFASVASIRIAQDRATVLRCSDIRVMMPSKIKRGWCNGMCRRCHCAREDAMKTLHERHQNICSSKGPNILKKTTWCCVGGTRKRWRHYSVKENSTSIAPLVVYMPLSFYFCKNIFQIIERCYLNAFPHLKARLIKIGKTGNELVRKTTRVNWVNQFRSKPKNKKISSIYSSRTIVMLVRRLSTPLRRIFSMEITNSCIAGKETLCTRNQLKYIHMYRHTCLYGQTKFKFLKTK